MFYLVLRGLEEQKYVEIFDRWWDQIIDAQLKANSPQFTFQPEYGPPDYTHTLPYTRQPVSNAWDIALWSAARFRKRFAEKMDGQSNMVSSTSA